MKKGFTLIELAIVVVVLGILITGIVGGQSIMESSKRQGIIAEVKQIKTAINAFKLEYDALPGDLKDANDYFDIEPTNGVNGNGDGKVNFDRRPFNQQEVKQSFPHLSAAEIFPRNYTKGINGYNFGTWGVYNTPKNGPISNAIGTDNIGYIILSVENRDPQVIRTNNSYNRKRGLVIRLGKGVSIDNNGASVSPKTAFAIDKKFDDGKIDNGWIFSARARNDSNSGIVEPFCASKNIFQDPPVEYSNIESETKSCFMQFYTDFK